MTQPALPSFDLVVATVDRSTELERLLQSLSAQTYRAFRVIVADQNPDGRLHAILAAHPELSVLHLRAPRGISRARNTALRSVEADVVAFPDDDCEYPPDLLAAVGARLGTTPELDAISGRLVDSNGVSPERMPADRCLLDRTQIWHGGVSAAMFFRRQLVELAGPFDERLGLGAGTPWESGEDTDMLTRAIDAGAHVEYDPGIVVRHALQPTDAASLRRLGRSSGAGVGFILRKHRYPARTVARMMIRPVGGVVVALAHWDTARARFHFETLRGRVAGYAAGGRSG